MQRTMLVKCVFTQLVSAAALPMQQPPQNEAVPPMEQPPYNGALPLKALPLKTAAVPAPEELSILLSVKPQGAA